MIIDSHAHFVPQTLLEEIRDVISSFPSIKLVKFENSFGFSFSNSPSTRPVNIKLSDKSSRLSWMDNQLIDLQVVGGWLDMFGYQIPIDEGIKWSKLINKHLKSFCDTSNNRFIPLATLPMQNGKAAAQLQIAIEIVQSTFDLLGLRRGQHRAVQHRAEQKQWRQQTQGAPHCAGVSFFVKPGVSQNRVRNFRLPGSPPLG